MTECENHEVNIQGEASIQSPVAAGHRRRIHYSGKYPKSYREKYKELNPEKYGDQIDMILTDEKKLVSCRKEAKKLVADKYTYFHTIETMLKG